MVLTREQEKAMFANLKKKDFTQLNQLLIQPNLEPEHKDKVEDELRVKELKERKELGLNSVEPVSILETELTDILQEVGNMDTGEINDSKLQKVVKESIDEILKREKFLPKGFTTDITEVSVREETGQIEFKKTGEGESGFYQFDFSIRKEDGKPTDFAGTAFGSISAGDVTDMELELFKVWLYNGTYQKQMLLDLVSLIFWNH